jgi:hypothetical protein
MQVLQQTELLLNPKIRAIPIIVKDWTSEVLLIDEPLFVDFLLVLL